MALTHLTLGPLVPFMEDFTTPAWVEVDGHRFTFDAEQGAYLDSDGQIIYLEPSRSDGVLTEDDYYELP